mmetsp:Transcript_46425/g.135229  ORF Transcript_46425/g.135229 Transcript_46425/m.135229 type:complete len:436 (+) Transcript_46425:462-1769(+)
MLWCTGLAYGNCLGPSSCRPSDPEVLIPASEQPSSESARANCVAEACEVEPRGFGSIEPTNWGLPRPVVPRRPRCMASSGSVKTRFCESLPWEPIMSASNVCRKSMRWPFGESPSSWGNSMLPELRLRNSSSWPQMSTKDFLEFIRRPLRVTVAAEVASFGASEITELWAMCASFVLPTESRWDNDCRLTVGVRCVSCAKRSISCRFIITCNSEESMSFGSQPKGFWISLAMWFKPQRTNTCEKAKVKDHHGLLTHWHKTKGVIKECRISKQSHVCAYGKGKGMEESLSASWKCTRPVASSWKDLERMGAGMFMTPVSMASTISCWIHWKTSSTLQSEDLRVRRLRVSMPSTSMSSYSKAALTPTLLGLSWLESSISARAKAWSMLNKRIRVFWNMLIFSSSALENLQKAVSELAASNQLARIIWQDVQPSQNLV